MITEERSRSVFVRNSVSIKNDQGETVRMMGEEKFVYLISELEKKIAEDVIKQIKQSL